MLHSSAARPSESTAYSTAARMAATCGQIFSLSMYHACCQGHGVYGRLLHAMLPPFNSS